MKVTIFLLVILCVVVVQIQAQCRRPREPSCRGARDEGRGGRDCQSGTAWYYNHRERECERMRYRGCGGNSNRYCSRSDCERRCIRRRDDD